MSNADVTYHDPQSPPSKAYWIQANSGTTLSAFWSPEYWRETQNLEGIGFYWDTTQWVKAIYRETVDFFVPVIREEI